MEALVGSEQDQINLGSFLIVTYLQGGCNYLKDVSYSNLQEEDLIRLGSFLIYMS